MARDFRDDAKELVSAGQFEHTLSLHMLKSFVKAGGEGIEAESYRHPLRTILDGLNEALISIAHMTRKDAEEHMIKKNLTYLDICEKAEAFYRTAKDNGDWLPAKNAVDSKAPPRGFGATAISRAEVMALFKSNGLPNSPSNKGDKGACHNCGETGHWARECTKNKKSDKKFAPKKGHGAPVSWKTIAPAPGASNSVTKDGKTFFWCGKCGRWTTTHDTAKHTGKREPTAAVASTSLVPDPSVWCTEIAKDPVWRMLLPYIVTLFLGYFAASIFPIVVLFVEQHGNSILQFTIISLRDILRSVVAYHCAIPSVLLWAVLYVLVLYVGCMTPGPEDSSGQRKIRRRWFQKQKNEVRRSRARSRSPGSIRDHNLHRRYPRHLRDQGKFCLRNGEYFTSDGKSFGQKAAWDRIFDSYFPPKHPAKAPAAKNLQLASVPVANRTQKQRQPLKLRTPRQVTRPCPPPPAPGLRVDPTLCSPTQSQLRAVHAIATQVDVAYVACADTSMMMRMILQAPARLRDALPNEATYPVIWDSGASISISPDRGDFVGPISTTGPIKRLRGISKGLSIMGEGHIMWMFLDTEGKLRSIKVPGYYTPDSKIRLLSTTSLLQSYPNEKISVEAHQMVLSGDPGSALGSIVARVNPSNNLPTSSAFRYDLGTSGPNAFAVTLSEVSNSNINLNEPEKELLRWHHRLGHINFKKVQFLLRSGVLSHSEAARRLHAAACKVTAVNYPKCAACQFGKQCRKPSPGVTTSAVTDRAGILTQGDLFPGQRISVDHFSCSTKGRLFTSRGKTSDSTMYSGGCIFVDHASKFVHVEFQSQLNTHETAKAKELFELACRDHGVVPQSYQSDNGTAFTSAGFKAHLLNFSQIIRFAGAGAHHQNGTAERSIRTVTSIARTMMLHAAIHWPEVADPALWPMAVAQAVYLVNRVPDPATGWSAFDLFARQRWNQNKFLDLNVWGCPAYVLEKRIADGLKIPRWEPRSHRSIYMGVSQKHASSVALLLNPDTGAITPQFHVVFDNWFATIANAAIDLPDFQSFEWQQLFGDSTAAFEHEEDDDDDPPPPDQAEIVAAQHRDAVARAIDTIAPAVPLPFVPPPAEPLVVDRLVPLVVQDAVSTTAPLPREPIAAPREPIVVPREPIAVPRELSPAPVQPLPIPVAPLAVVHPQREEIPTVDTTTQRTRRPPTRFVHVAIDPHFLQSVDAMGLSASASDPDSFTFEQAMASPDREEWMKAAAKEIASLESKNTWDEVNIEKARTKVLPGTWVFKVKRTPDGIIRKYKARYCVRGDLMEGDAETHSPVVAWSSVRLFLIMSLTLGWYTCAIDFSNAFVQAHLEEPIWIHLPRGFNSNRHGKTVLSLKRSLYGLTFAGRLWYEHLIKALKSMGFTQSTIDPCLLFKKDLLIVVYVDDVGVASPTKEGADELVKALIDRGFELTREGSFSEFLGIKIDRNEADGSLSLTQSGLIQRILVATNMEHCNPNWIPASPAALGSDPDGEPMDETWNYRSVVGMLLYLSTNTRPDITFAVSQVARFSHSPKKSHATAVKMIVRYLARTQHLGTTIIPNGTLGLDCYVDADFGGLYKREPDSSSDSARSRTGYIIMLGGCPLTWKSQLQSEICLSTLESEYVALSASLRTLLPIKRLLFELAQALVLPGTMIASIHCRTFEDNNGALILATTHRLTSRTRHINTKCHWFWANFKDGEFSIERVDTKKQRADYLTKGLAREPFEGNRRPNQGW